MKRFFGFILILILISSGSGSFAQEKKKCGGSSSSCCSSKSGQVSAAWNKVCPVMGGKVDPEAVTAEFNGKVYGFCCNGCDSKFKKDPAKYSANLSADGSKFTGKKEKH